MHKFIRSLFLLALGACGAVSTPALAQCGYGTSSQDCFHQQRDADAARQAEQQYRQQMQGEDGGMDDGGDDRPSGPSAPRAPDYGYVVVVWHSDAADVWATWNRRTEQDATASAMSACRDVMGEGCTVALSAWNSTVAVAQGSDGDLAVGWGVKTDEAAAKAIESCRKKNPECAIKYSFTAKPYTVADDHYPGASVARMAWAVVAWPKSRPADKWLGKVWLASGQGDYMSSEKRLLERCKRDTGIDCQISQAAMGDGGTKKGAVVVAYFQPGVGTMWVASPSRRYAEDRIKADCASAGAACTNIRFFDPFTSRLGPVDSPQS
ncbi:DUF4189 domain-containing protein [Sphingopyxis sp.]|uniref:DUF4189 domain-containing protein n=1 Tax=Sphingopyxis sp. TaxID=1908224 RepID=UPI003D0EED38